MKRLSTLLITALVAVGCMPKLYQPTVVVSDQYHHTTPFPTDTLIGNERWWEGFGDSILDGLIELALLENRDLWVAASRIDEARHQLRIARSEFLPDVELGIKAEGNYNRQTKIVEQYSLTPTLSWEISLFGAMRHTSEAARAAFESSVWGFRAMELTVAANVATTYFTLLQYEHDLQIATRTTRLRRESAALMDSLYRYGMSSGVDADQAYGLVYSSEADMLRYQNAIEATRAALSVLVGQTPYTYPFVGSRIHASLEGEPRGISVGLPSELVARRPDILQSYYQLAQAAAEVGVARSNRFPSIVLTANTGAGSSSIKGLTSSNPAVWQAMGSIVQPIFSFGRLKANERVAVEQYNQQAFNYELTILNAFAEVESALSAIASTRHEIDRYGALVGRYEDIVEKAYALYRNGMADYLDVIDAERTLYSARMQHIDLQATQRINYVTLCKALGGGW